MKLQPFVEQLEATKEFKDFKNNHPNAFLVAGFFVLDFETNQHLHQIDYFVPGQKKVAAFTLGEQIMVQMLDTINEKTPEKLDSHSNIDLDALEGILEDEMKNRSMTESIKKIIAVIQKIEGKKLWIINSVLSGMEILKAHIEDSSKTVLKMESSSVMDYIKKIPGAASMGGAPSAGGEAEAAAAEPTPEDIEAKIHELDRLKKELEKEKKRIEDEDKAEKKPAKK